MDARSASAAKNPSERIRELVVLLEGHQHAPAENDLGLLTELKVLSRDPATAGELYTRNGVSIISRYAFHSTLLSVAYESLRILANALYLKPETRQIFANLGNAPTVVARYETSGGINVENEFLCSRILFFLTYDTLVDFKQLLVQEQLSHRLSQCIHNHALHDASKIEQSPSGLNSDMALAETLKLMYNVSHQFPDSCQEILSTRSDLLVILHKQTPSPHAPLDPPCAQLVNLLLNIETSDRGSASERVAYLDGDLALLTGILDGSLKTYRTQDLDVIVAPLISLIRTININATEETRKVLQRSLLADAAEREKPLGQSDTLFSKLIRLTTSAQTPTLRTLVPQLMFELSDKDPSTFIRNVGYGYASGFLINNGIDSSELHRQNGHAFGQTHGGSRNTASGDVNFTTGQLLDSEPQDGGPPMTDEEKEREAEKLFVLFERLKKNGVIDVVNPVEAAARAGRFEEINSDEDG